jgi:hypothetical protein
MPEPQQIKQLEKFLSWLKTCDFTCTVSSMQGSFVHVKFFLQPPLAVELKDQINKMEK